MMQLVWIVCSNRWNSAITEYALRSAQALHQQGTPVVVHGLEGKPLLQRSKELSLRVQAWRNFNLSLPNLLRWRRLFQQDAPQQVLCFGGPETILLYFLPNSAVRTRFRGQNEDLVGRENRGIRFRWGHRHLDYVLAPSPTLATKLAVALGVDRMRTVFLGCDEKKWSFQAHLYQPTERPKIMIVGRFDPIKGHHHFLGLFAKLIASWPDDEPRPYLEMIGYEANLKSTDLEAWATELGLTLEDYGILSSRLEDLPQRVMQATLGVVCSLGSEVICRVAEEFLMSGVPLYVSGVGCLEDYLQKPDWGESYRNLNNKEKVDCLRRILLSAHREHQSRRLERAQQSLEQFSLGRMGRELQRSLNLR